MSKTTLEEFLAEMKHVAPAYECADNIRKLVSLVRKLKEQRDSLALLGDWYCKSWEHEREKPLLAIVNEGAGE